MCVSARGGRSQPGRLCKCDLKGGTYLCLFPFLTRSSMSRMGVARSCSRLFSGDTDRNKHTPFGPLSPRPQETPRMEQLLRSGPKVWPP